VQKMVPKKRTVGSDDSENMHKLLVPELKNILKLYRPALNTTGMRKADLQTTVSNLLKSDKGTRVAQRIREVLNPESRQPVRMVVTTTRPSSNTVLAIRTQANGLNPLQFLPLRSFCVIEKILFNPKHLTSLEPEEVTRSSLRFDIPDEFVDSLSETAVNSIPRYEVHLRLMEHKVGEGRPDTFPNNIEISLNGQQVNLQNIVNSQMDLKPVILNSYCNLKVGVRQYLTVEWQQEARSFVLGIWLVQHVNSTILSQKFLNSGVSQYEETQKMIKSKLKGNSEEDGISMDSMKISLICPLTRQKMGFPIRSRNCSHLQCFDLNSYFMMNESRPKWKCPICNKDCPYDSLVFDRYFLEILDKVDDSVKEVELLTNGNWKVVDADHNRTASMSTIEDPQSTMHDSKADVKVEMNKQKLDPRGNSIIVLDDDE